MFFSRLIVIAVFSFLLNPSYLVGQSIDDLADLFFKRTPAAEVTKSPAGDSTPLPPGTVQCANLVYADGQSSKCFADHFLRVVSESTNIQTAGQFETVDLEAVDLFDYPFAVMTGEGKFSLTPEQRTNMQNYLSFGGFIVASSGCSCPRWSESFRREINDLFPEIGLSEIPASHPIFSTVYSIEKLPSKVSLQGLEIDGRIVLVFSPDGLNDTKEAEGRCCCCGGSEIRNARQINVNLLVYALTH